MSRLTQVYTDAEENYIDLICFEDLDSYDVLCEVLDSEQCQGLIDAIYKLAEYENIGTIEDFKNLIKEAQIMLKNNEKHKQSIKELSDSNSKFYKENAELKKKLQSAIVPKFYYKDIVYYVENVSGKPKIVECMVTGIVPYKHKKFYSYEIESLKPHYYCVDEEHIFATKEEAQQKLKELEGK